MVDEEGMWIIWRNFREAGLSAVSLAALAAPIVVTGVLLAAAGLAAEPENVALPRHILTNEGLVVLGRAGVGDGLLVDLVRSKRTQFDTSADALASLVRHGLSEAVVRAVVEKQEHVQLHKPQVTVSPVAAGGAPINVDAGEVMLVARPSNGKRGRGEPDRWYKVSLR